MSVPAFLPVIRWPYFCGKGITLALTPYGVRKVKGCMDLKVLCKQNLCQEVGGFPGFLVLQTGMCVCVRVVASVVFDSL